MFRNIRCVLLFTFFSSALLAQTGETCGVCHRTILGQWEKSPHAVSWTSSQFQRQSERIGATNFCAQCHAPESVWNDVNLRTPDLPSSEEFDPELASVPKARSEVREDGVTCVSCHGIQVLRPKSKSNEFLGPYHSTSGHQGRRSDVFSDYRICASCHGRPVDDYTPGLQASTEDFHHAKALQFEFDFGNSDCSNCHMPRKEDRLVQLSVFKDAPLRAVGDHTFTGVRYTALEEALSLELTPQGVAIKNVSIGHPLQISSTTSYYLVVTGPEGSSQRVDFKDAHLLAPETSSTLALPFAPSEEGITVELWIDEEDLEPRKLLEKSLPVGSKTRPPTEKRGPRSLSEQLYD